jgi:glyoxylase-like metal-dependent hydrolase (beta-lactamase superfamily II)
MKAGRGLMVGGIEVIPLWDGPWASSSAKIPNESHRTQAEALVAAAGRNAWTLDVFAFLLRIDERLVLIDTGCGQLGNPDPGKLSEALAALGVTHDQISTVFLTHAHRDHYGGLIDAHGRVAFPNAELIIHDAEARFWLDTPFEEMPERGRPSFHRTREFLSRYSTCLRRVTDQDDMFGISAVLAPGHTIGHTCWLLKSGDASLLAWGDLIHIAEIHLAAPYIAMEYDYDPELAQRSRLHILDWVTREKIPVAGAHLPQPGIGTIVRAGDGYAYEPVRLATLATGVNQ